MQVKKLISIVIPAFNEGDCVPILYEGIAKVIDQLNNYDFEVIIVDNGSFDHTFDELKKVSEKDNRFKILKLTRNCGPDGGISAGLKFAKGDAAIITYADLEDPPEMFAKFLEKWEEGYQHVYGITRARQGTWLRKQNAKLFYFLINKLTKNGVPKNVADFRLVDRKVYEAMNQITEKNRFLRGLFSWLNYKSIGIPYDRNLKRAAGKSKATTFVVIAVALRAIMIFSNFPLRIAGFVGGATSVFSFLGIIYFSTQYFLFDNLPFNGFGTIICFMLLMFGIMFMMIWIIGEYIALIYDEVKGRPLFLVEEAIGF
ncbi:MAG: glycosyltransferase family 2 protein [Pseudomonadota bacterium]